MARMICADTAVEKLKEIIVLSEHEQKLLEQYIASCMTEDAEKVIRCKDCKFSKLPSVLTQTYGLPGSLVCENRNAPSRHRLTLEGSYCSYGERKENGKEG